jgi:hypothetical protein
MYFTLLIYFLILNFIGRYHKVRKVQYRQMFMFVPSSGQGLTAQDTRTFRLPNHHERQRPTALITQWSCCRFLTCLQSLTRLIQISSEAWISDQSFVHEGFHEYLVLQPLTITVLASHAWQQYDCLQSSFQLYDTSLSVVELAMAKWAHLWDHIIVNDGAAWDWHDGHAWERQRPVTSLKNSLYISQYGTTLHYTRYCATV